MEYKIIEVSKLKMFKRRDLRQIVLEKLEERIVKGYNPARPLTVIANNGVFYVADGNHRLEIANKLDIKELPCVIREGNIYKIGIECNADEDTYAPEDLFDRLDAIRQLKVDGNTQSEIGEIIGVSRDIIQKYNTISDRIVTEILNLCKDHQKGRVTENMTSVTFDFTEGWFRDSGLYDLWDEFQEKLITGFIDDKCNWKKEKVQSTSAKYKLWQEMITISENELQDQDLLPELVEMVKNGVFKTIQQLRDKIETLNADAKNKLIQGDCLTELEKLTDCTIDLVITDPPYGIEYKSNFSKYKDNVTKDGIINDDEEIALDLFDNVCDVLKRKTKESAHLYFFIDINSYPKFRSIAEKYFDVRIPLIWYKSDAGIGDLQYDWINGTELILYCTKGTKKINKRRVNVLQYPKLHTSKMIHPTQKPEELITEILTVSAQKYDIFCDPFMGSGSHIKSAKKYGCNYIGIELDKTIFDKAKVNIGE